MTIEKNEPVVGIGTKDVKYIVYVGEDYYPAAYAFTNYGAAKKEWDKVKADRWNSPHRRADYLAKVIECNGEEDLIDGLDVDERADLEK